MSHCRFLLLTCILIFVWLRVVFFRPETVVTSFLHLMMLTCIAFFCHLLVPVEKFMWSRMITWRHIIVLYALTAHPKHVVIIAIVFGFVFCCFSCRTRAYMFSHDEGSCYIFRPESIIESFSHLMILLSKVFINH